MNAYEVDVWRGVQHNGKFSHNDNRVELIHARNEEEARKKITLRKGYVHKGFGACDLVIEVSSESIYSCRKVGNVKIGRFYVYTDSKGSTSVGRGVGREMNTQLEYVRNVYQVLHRTFIVLRKRYVFGVFSVLFCTLREVVDGAITEKRLKCKIRRYGDHPGYSAYLDVVVNDTKQSYLIDRRAYEHLNFEGKAVWFRLNDPQPWLGSICVSAFLGKR